MGLKALNVGDADFRLPGTSNQTGNNAPKFPWVKMNVGRVAKVAGLCCAYHLGATDEEMGQLHKIPKAEDTHALFVSLMPWFPAAYDSYRATRATLIGYTGELEPFNPMDIENRVRYCFAKPGSRMHSVTMREYGISKEHPKAVEQNRKLRVVWVRCSETITHRLRVRKSITPVEAFMWGRL